MRRVRAETFSALQLWSFSSVSLQLMKEQRKWYQQRGRGGPSSKENQGLKPIRDQKKPEQHQALFGLSSTAMTHHQVHLAAAAVIRAHVAAFEDVLKGIDPDQ